MVVVCKASPRINACEMKVMYGEEGKIGRSPRATSNRRNLLSQEKISSEVSLGDGDHFIMEL